MKTAYTYIIISLTIVSITVGIWLFKRKQQLKGLGKAVVTSRPPRVRIVYSKKQISGDRKSITSSKDAYDILTDIWSKQIDTREEMIVLLLDRSNSVLGYHVLSMGGITGTVADLRLLFSVALNSLATSVIMSHNHPSGNLNPSKQDQDLTKKVQDAGKLMDIQLLDHVIITNSSYYSFADEGLI
ncbi:MAG: JAB domain-containing protein [Bacteroidales bacterium]|nr:JAB domain-containing protein [Bacteroidales bacterium]